MRARPRWDRIAAAGIGAVVGGVGGVITYAFTQLSGLILYVATGAVLGIAGTFAIQAYLNKITLVEMKVSVPQLSELTFVINNDSRQIAWKLFVETSTRITSQPLAAPEGYIREALASVHSLFGLVRELLKASKPSTSSVGQSVEFLGISMLNQVLRPFVSKWHPLLSEYERQHPDEPESEWDRAGECRSELREMQVTLREYVLGFARLAGVDDAERIIDGGSPK